MSIQRYRRKPDPGSREDQYAARYVPGTELGDLLAVARMADDHADLAEVRFRDATVLAVRYRRFYDEHPSRIEYETVEAGRFLAFSPGEGFLYVAAETNWRQFYDLVPDDQAVT